MGSTLKNRPKTSFMARNDAAIPPEVVRKRRREIPSFLLADSASSLMRSSLCFCFLVCGTGMYSPFETLRVGIGDRKVSASSALSGFNSPQLRHFIRVHYYSRCVHSEHFCEAEG